jgi:DNA-binding transcriptional ArsR family regulator
MQDVCYIQDVDQAAALLKPLRLELLKRMAEPRSCPALADALGQATQKVYYHIKALETAGLVEKVGERRVGGIMEGLYQARARSYWLSPQLVDRVGGPRRTHDQLSLDFLLSLAEELQADVGQLAQDTDRHVPSLGLSAQIELRDSAERGAFLQELNAVFQALAQKYGRRATDPPATDGTPLFRLMLACYPTMSPDGDPPSEAS